MSFVGKIVVQFLAEHLADRQNYQEWLTERLERDFLSSPNDSEEPEAPDCKPIVDRLVSVDREFQIFVNNKYDDRFTELTDPLVSRLKNGSSRKYYEAYKTIANELFMGEISWIRIVTLLVYSSELVNRILTELPQNDKDRTYKLVSQVIKCTCTYFEENLLQWIEEQDNGWNNIIELTKDPAESNRNGSNAGRCMKQYLGVAAFAAVIGGLYICSKLTLQ